MQGSERSGVRTSVPRSEGPEYVQGSVRGRSGIVRVQGRGPGLLAAAAEVRARRHVRPRRLGDARLPARRLRVQGVRRLMRRGRAALAVVVALSGTRTVAAESCPTRASLGGD